MSLTMPDESVGAHSPPFVFPTDLTDKDAVVAERHLH